MAGIGYWALVLTLGVSLYTALVSVLGARRRNGPMLESARNGALVAAATGTIAAGALLYLLLSRDYNLKYVAEHVSSALPNVYVFSAFWAGQEGSLLLWLWFLVLMTGSLILWTRIWRAPYAPYVLATMAVTQAFLALVLILLSNPFAVLPNPPLQGRGMNPLLQNLWMVIHPPVVFLSYAAYTVPFAMAIGGVATGKLDTDWLRAVRGWALFAWLFLGTGIVMGAWWAYLELGWGGYWGWDPVENSSLVPWLVGTALLHSLMMQERRDTFRSWNLWLIGLTFALVLFATFVTRSGVIQSVHAFGRSAIGTYFLAYIGLCLAVLGMLWGRRRRKLGKPYAFQELLSRETSLLLTNLLLLGTALVVLVGTLFPVLVELIQGRQAALDTTFYERTVGPLALLLTALIGICPWLAWGATSGQRLRRTLLFPAAGALLTGIIVFALGGNEPAALVSFVVCTFVGLSLLETFYRGTVNRRARTGEAIPLAFLKAVGSNRRRYGAHIVHLGIVLIAVGITGSSLYQEEVQVALAPGEQIDVGRYTLHYQDLISEELPDRQRFAAVVGVSNGDRQLATLRPEKAFHWNVEQWVTEVAIRSTLKEDLYLILAGSDQDGLASFRILINPLVAWLWVGGSMLLAGGVLAWWPAPERSQEGSPT
ncbi:MAG TPA: heme lyase CcmF/NrfE family subunit [Anaerolineae bacterium]|nr:heme lyase CcmF/NrfE family subunit [Anaerolineae bacterium]